MVLTTKERQRRFRERLKQDPERYEEFKQKMRQRIHDQKVAGKITLIDTQSEKNKRSQRKYWRQQKRRLRSRQKDLEKELTPPSSPSTSASRDQEPPALKRLDH
ncbi:hypothetical protein ACJMK2_025291 [Sinanodonta woodiana]|uniref:Uncharacterized protein n=1 Tax=Sinanodonta woodiana TaxID=1069815 RepID=A0ABD3XGJ2_SINWO